TNEAIVAAIKVVDQLAVGALQLGGWYAADRRSVVGLDTVVVDRRLVGGNSDVCDDENQGEC
ncbi:MAG TPA: hypothetical protein VFB90_08450, partial [Dehalococcoidia bacterium]|nr:hypothetical protein [Dehalococcoidia bacterium]